MTPNQIKQILEIWENTCPKSRAIQKLQFYWEKEFNYKISSSSLRRYLKKLGVNFRIKAPNLKLG